MEVARVLEFIKVANLVVVLFLALLLVLNQRQTRSIFQFVYGT